MRLDPIGGSQRIERIRRHGRVSPSPVRGDPKTTGTDAGSTRAAVPIANAGDWVVHRSAPAPSCEVQKRFSDRRPVARRLAFPAARSLEWFDPKLGGGIRASSGVSKSASCGSAFERLRKWSSPRWVRFRGASFRLRGVPACSALRNERKNQSSLSLGRGFVYDAVGKVTILIEDVAHPLRRRAEASVAACVWHRGDRPALKLSRNVCAV